MAISHLFAGVPVADLGSALAWYERLLGQPADASPNENEGVWHVADKGSIYVVVDTVRAGRGLLTLMVDDLEAFVIELGERGLSTGAIETAPGLYRKAVLTDPEGNAIQLGQALSGSD